MKKHNPVGSLIGLIFIAVFLAGMALATWRSGGQAFSPGRLTRHTDKQVKREGFASHAEMEGQCDRCHRPLETTQDPLCLDCHGEVKTQIELNDGTHAHIEVESPCASCHSDHQGIDFDPIQDAFDSFDHQRTHFNLALHSVDYEAKPLDCKACHQFQNGFSIQTASCLHCHEKQDPAFMAQHVGSFGKKCAVCHDGLDTMAKFDHAVTDFPLQEAHSRLACSDCHMNVNPSNIVEAKAIFESTPSGCIDCHQEPQIHVNMFEDDCAACHTPASWSPASLNGAAFNHQTAAGFSLVLHTADFQDRPITCTTCHTGSLDQFDLAACTTCHAEGEERTGFMLQHQEQFGSACLDCHDGVDRLRNFDHNNFFTLEGRHAQIECEECHLSQVFLGTPASCIECHAEPEIHAGFFGQQCQYCHTSEGWFPANLRLHRFPLDHGSQSVQECTMCHTTRYDVYTCYGCHDHQPEPILASHTRASISASALPECAACHPDGR